MQYFVLASDYDGTLADHATVSPSTLAALKRFRDAGGQPLLVTGREIADLMSIFPEYEVFHWIVGENGAVLFQTETKKKSYFAILPRPNLRKLCAAKVSRRFIQAG